MAIINGDLLRVGARLLFNGVNDIINVFHVVCQENNAQDFDDLRFDLLEAIEDLFDLIDTNLANNVTFADMSIANLTQEEVYGSSAWPALTAGSNSNDAINPGLGVFTYSPTPIPHVQGRKWFGAFTEQDNADGVWASGVTNPVALIMVALESLLASSIGAEWLPVIAHLKKVVDGELVDVVPPVLTGYNSSTVTNNAGVLTRRRPGSGS